MKKNSMSIFLIGILTVFLSNSLFANPDSLFYSKKRTLKSGPYFGLQSGRFYALEYGWELQRKTREDLVHSNTTAVHHGFNASFDFSRLNPILGYDIGFWSRTGNLDLTYGLSAAVRTDLKQLRYGLCPSVGIKVWQLHVQTGMYVLAPFYIFDNANFNTNTFFISAHFLLVKHKKTKGAN